jgi:hypothetical protein
MKECNYLDAIFHNVYTRVPEKQRAWMSESHLERAPKRKKPTGAPPPQWNPREIRKRGRQPRSLFFASETFREGFCLVLRITRWSDCDTPNKVRKESRR